MGALPWFGGVAVAALLLGAWGSFVVTKRFTEGRALRAEKALLAFEAQLSEQTSIAEREAARRQVEAMEAIRRRDQEITAAIDAIPGAILRDTRRQFAELRETINDPTFACMRLPLPLDYLERVRQPAGSAAAKAGTDSAIRETAGNLFSVAPDTRARWNLSAGVD